MCGIAGVFGDYPAAVLRGMSARQAHRGPDGSGFYDDESAGIGLAHRRLAIIDLSEAGLQPFWDVERRAAIVFNGEIYNYRELREELVRDGWKFSSETDTEVLLNLYLRDGAECLARLNGMFAFAIWQPSVRRLFLARDAMGIKPLYYHSGPRGFAFASELKAFFAIPGLDRTLDSEAIAHHLTYLYCPAPRTLLAGVRKCRPGEAMVVGPKGRVEKQWFYFRPPYEAPVSRFSVNESARQLTTVLEQAVRRQMVADVPVGAFLSGGLDSSAIVAFARRLTEARMDCFTIDDGGALKNEGFADDLPYARQVAKSLDVNLHVVRGGADMANHLTKTIRQMDEPQGDPAAFNVLLISELARSCGIKVLLSGAGGDDLFSGYRRHFALMQERWWSWLPTPARSLLRTTSALAPRNSAVGRRLAKGFQYADASPERRLAGYFAWLEPQMVRSLLAPDRRATLRDVDLFSPLLTSLAALPPATAPLNRMLFLEQRHFLADHNLGYTDKMSMAAGVEVRVPFLDPDVVHFAATLDPGLKQRGATGKWIFKRAMEPFLPREVIYRPKTGFGAPLRRWLKHEWKPLVDEALSEESLRARNVFDPAAVRRLIDQDRAGRIDASYSIFQLLCMEIWFREFVDEATA